MGPPLKTPMAVQYQMGAKRRHVSVRQLYLTGVVILAVVVVTLGLWSWYQISPRQNFLVAAHRLPVGLVITSADMTSVAANPSAVPSGALQQAPDAIGQTVAETLEPGDFISTAHLSDAPGRVASGLAPGQRLINIPTNGVSALVDGLQPGDHFDLLESFTSSAEAGPSLSGALIEGLVIRSISADGAFQVQVPLAVAVFIAQTESGGKISIFASSDTAKGSGVPVLLTGQVCQVFLASDGTLVPESSLPLGAMPCPGIYSSPLPPGTPSPTPSH